jgi:hypothetical protein
VCREHYYPDGQLCSKISANGTPVTHATLSIPKTGKREVKGGEGVCYETYYKNGNLHSKTSANGTSAIPATLSIAPPLKVEGTGGEGVVHQRFFNNEAPLLTATVDGNAKLSWEGCDAITAETNTKARYTKWEKKGDVVNHEEVTGNAELYIDPRGKGEVRTTEGEQGVIMVIQPPLT